MAGPLNLSDADLGGFDAVESGSYNAEVFAMTEDAIKNTDGTGKMPAGTPMIKVQFKLLSAADGDASVENRRVFSQYTVPPKEYEDRDAQHKKNAQMMRGMIARLFIALGDTEDKVRNAKFDPDFADYVGRPCVVIVGKEPKRNRDKTVVEGEFVNVVKGVKLAGSLGAQAPGGVL